MHVEMDFPLSDWLHTRAAGGRAKDLPYVIGVGGGVAVGKSTFAAALREIIQTWPEHPRVEGVATDGFLFANRVLAERGITMRKGFPESYDVPALRQAIAAIKRGERVVLPLYSHVTYDIDTEHTHTVERPAIVILDGLHLAQVEQPGVPRLIDCLIYLDAAEEVIERWFCDRLVPLMAAGVDDPKSFYYAFRAMGPDERRTFARRVWQGINLPNLREHIVKDRAAADLVLHKAADHRIVAAEPRTP